ncbi:MAG: AAA family ATPase, partial [Lysobacteraceae bacterium]
MLKQLTIKNLTVFPNAELTFGRRLNVIVGENGAGKTHLLKMAYSVLAASYEDGKRPNTTAPTKTQLQTRIAEKIV